MTIEPLGSAMTFQAQQQTQKPAEKPENADMDVATADAGSNIDKTTPSVRAAENSGQENGSGGEESRQQHSQENIKKAVDQMNKQMQNAEAIFGIHDKTNRVTIKIVDKESKKVIRELPPEKTLDMIAKIWEMAGILVDEKR